MNGDTGGIAGSRSSDVTPNRAGHIALKLHLVRRETVSPLDVHVGSALDDDFGRDECDGRQDPARAAAGAAEDSRRQADDGKSDVQGVNAGVLFVSLGVFGDAAQLGEKRSLIRPRLAGGLFLGRQLFVIWPLRLMVGGFCR